MFYVANRGSCIVHYKNVSFYSYAKFLLQETSDVKRSRCYKISYPQKLAKHNQVCLAE